MTKRRVSKQRRRVPRPVSMSSTVVVPFRDITTIQRSASAGYEVSSINLNIPSFAAGSRVRSVGALYEFFRFRSLRVKAISDTTATSLISSSDLTYLTGLAHAIGFIPSPSADYTAPTTFDELMQFPNAQLEPSHHNVSISMGRAALQGSTPTKWYHTATTGTPPAADSSAGSVVYVTRASAAQGSQSSYSYVMISGVVEFKAPLTSGDAFGLQCSTVGEEKKLRIDTLGAHFEYDHPRTSDRRIPNQGSSVPNTPVSNASTGQFRLTNSEGDGRSNRDSLDRPRLVR